MNFVARENVRCIMTPLLSLFCGDNSFLHVPGCILLFLINQGVPEKRGDSPQRISLELLVRRRLEDLSYSINATGTIVQFLLLQTFLMVHTIFYYSVNYFIVPSFDPYRGTTLSLCIVPTNFILT